MSKSRGEIVANRVLGECGIVDPTEITLETIVRGRGASLRFLSLHQADGRIVFGKRKAIITINDNIEFPGKRRFALAHELGHFEMHRNHFLIHNDNDATLEYFKDGHQETEANEFAAELLMPQKLFEKETRGKALSPQLFRVLARRFETSITSIAYRYCAFGSHPICLVYSYNNQVKYWKKSHDFHYRIKNLHRLAPPSDSVSAEFFSLNRIYHKEDSQQEVMKSTWLELNNNDRDSVFYEFCIITPRYNTVLSVIWED
jgi:Zn-dependent peptidase ImmA (M78 family)